MLFLQRGAPVLLKWESGQNIQLGLGFFPVSTCSNKRATNRGPLETPFFNLDHTEPY